MASQSVEQAGVVITVEQGLHQDAAFQTEAPMQGQQLFDGAVFGIQRAGLHEREPGLAGQ